jgi:hypothetical protein
VDDTVSNVLIDSPMLADYYDLVYHGDAADIYRLKPQYEAGVEADPMLMRQKAATVLKEQPALVWYNTQADGNP